MSILGISFCWSLFWSHRSAILFKQIVQTQADDTTKVTRSLQNAKAGLTVLRILTLDMPTDLKIWNKSISIGIDTTTIYGEVRTLQNSLTGQTKWNIETFDPTISQLEDTIQELLSLLSGDGSATNPKKNLPSLTHWYLHKKLGPDFETNMRQASSLLSLVKTMLTTPSEYVILLQNADEIRASGGFMGSYIRFSNDGRFISVSPIQDIYEPAGQFTGFVPAPTGALEYLSEGKGLKLQDANWYADFSQSAQTTLHFFSLGDEKRLGGVIAINSHLILEILKLTGPIYLPDLDQYVTPENFAELARQDRESFFPGSKQKTVFLNHFFTQLKIQATNTIQKPLPLSNFFNTLLRGKYILLYHELPEIQSKIEQTNLDGKLPQIETDTLFLYPLESNVGINKANQAMQRSYDLTINETQSTLSISYQNNNRVSTPKKILNPNLLEATHLHYVNYQRLLLNPDVRITAITQDGKQIEKWDDELIKTSDQNQYRQIGFLSTVIEENSSTVTITLEHSPSTNFQKIMILKQPGIPTSTFTITQLHLTTTKINSYILDTDTTIQLEV